LATGGGQGCPKIQQLVQDPQIKICCGCFKKKNTKQSNVQFPDVFASVLSPPKGASNQTRDILD